MSESEKDRYPRNRVQEARLQALIPRVADLAKKSGVNASQLSRIELNRIPLTVPHARKIAQALGCEWHELYCKDDNLALNAS